MKAFKVIFAVIGGFIIIVVIFSLYEAYIDPSSKCVEGDCENGIGTRKYMSSGNEYKGSFKDGFPDGKGILFNNVEKTRYEGTFYKGRPSGPGSIFNEQNELLYSGEFIDGEYVYLNQKKIRSIQNEHNQYLNYKAQGKTIKAEELKNEFFKMLNEEFKIGRKYFSNGKCQWKVSYHPLEMLFSGNGATAVVNLCAPYVIFMAAKKDTDTNVLKKYEDLKVGATFEGSITTVTYQKKSFNDDQILNGNQIIVYALVESVIK